MDFRNCPLLNFHQILELRVIVLQIHFVNESKYNSMAKASHSLYSHGDMTLRNKLSFCWLFRWAVPILWHVPDVLPQKLVEHVRSTTTCQMAYVWPNKRRNCIRFIEHLLELLIAFTIPIQQFIIVIVILQSMKSYIY